MFVALKDIYIQTKDERTIIEDKLYFIYILLQAILFKYY
jgi:hypothetical protein